MRLECRPHERHRVQTRMTRCHAAVLQVAARAAARCGAAQRRYATIPSRAGVAASVRREIWRRQRMHKRTSTTTYGGHVVTMTSRLLLATRRRFRWRCYRLGSGFGPPSRSMPCRRLRLCPAFGFFERTGDGVLAQGVVMAADERRNLEHLVLPEIGHLLLGDVRPSHVRAVLTGVSTKTYRQGKTNVVEKRYRAETITKVRGVMHRLFRSAEEEDQIERNPLTAVRCPRTREIKKERSILTDDEFERFIGCAEVDLELRMLSLVARCEGGMRTGDLHHWDWTMIDRDGFEQCTIPRSKTRTPQPLEIPGVLRPFVRAWWQSAGGPEAGPVFPVRRGGPRGAAEAPEQRLRQAPAAGSVSGGRGPHAPDRRARDPTGHAHRSRTVRRGDATRFDTATTLPVDFHSFRRAFNTALAESGVNLQRAMHVAGHADAKTHMRYVMRGSGMRSIPAEALPQIAASAGSIVTDCDDWTAGKMKSSMISARPAGLEPATRGLEEGSQRTTM